mmetsp:Transcript_16659/g.47508  ORF Transcript_16659/g.47508 Transcript_16659/m.47508 type:complete len:207 (+) Transcript_16659:758-1378(+)
MPPWDRVTPATDRGLALLGFAAFGRSTGCEGHLLPSLSEPGGGSSLGEGGRVALSASTESVAERWSSISILHLSNSASSPSGEAPSSPLWKRRPGLAERPRPRAPGGLKTKGTFAMPGLPIGSSSRHASGSSSGSPSHGLPSLPIVSFSLTAAPAPPSSAPRQPPPASRAQAACSSSILCRAVASHARMSRSTWWAAAPEVLCKSC